jgi:hypothetical protein
MHNKSEPRLAVHSFFRGRQPDTIFFRLNFVTAKGFAFLLGFDDSRLNPLLEVEEVKEVKDQTWGIPTKGTSGIPVVPCFAASKP